MPHKTCAHCNVEITHHETAVARDGKTYYCPNCADAAQKEQFPSPASYARIFLGGGRAFATRER